MEKATDRAVTRDEKVREGCAVGRAGRGGGERQPEVFGKLSPEREVGTRVDWRALRETSSCCSGIRVLSSPCLLPVPWRQPEAAPASVPSSAERSMI